MQGAFRDHIPLLNRCGAESVVVTASSHLTDVDRIILPGGESTVMGKFIRELDLLGHLRERLAAGMPAWGICAGAILLAETVDGAPGLLQALPIRVTRNAYGRQRESCWRPVRIAIFKEDAYPAIFIRAPRIETIAPQVTAHARVGQNPVFVQYGRIMATTFHPELNEDTLFHSRFLAI